VHSRADTGETKWKLRMRRLVLLSATVAGIVMLLQIPARADDRAEIKALEDRQFEAFKARDIERYMTCFVPNESLFIFDGAGPPREYVGARAWRKYIADFFASSSGPIESQYRDFNLVIEQNLGFAHFVVDEAFTVEGKRWKFTERWTDVFQKIDGKWAIVHEHTSFPFDFAKSQTDLSSSK
jgi:ketosteroid isomerase-like protein